MKIDSNQLPLETRIGLENILIQTKTIKKKE
jgi:hypothetical protein